MGGKASNLAVVGELGRYPLDIDIKYWIRLHEDKTNCILKAALDENNKYTILVHCRSIQVICV